MEKIAIYGGAFNPPTIGHKALITQVLTGNHVSKIIFSPDGERLDKDYKIPRNKRIEIMKIFYEELKNDGLNVDFDDYFLTRESQKTTTMEVEKYFSEKLGFKPIHIFGIDTITSMSTRGGNINKYIENDLKKIFILRKGFKVPENIEMQNYIMLDLEILEISSTTVREMIKNKLIVEHILTPGVHEFIKENNLYTN